MWLTPRGRIQARGAVKQQLELSASGVVLVSESLRHLAQPACPESAAPARSWRAREGAGDLLRVRPYTERSVSASCASAAIAGLGAGEDQPKPVVLLARLRFVGKSSASSRACFRAAGPRRPDAGRALDRFVQVPRFDHVAAANFARAFARAGRPFERSCCFSLVRSWGRRRARAARRPACARPARWLGKRGGITENPLVFFGVTRPPRGLVGRRPSGGAASPRFCREAPTGCSLLEPNGSSGARRPSALFSSSPERAGSTRKFAETCAPPK